jgi:DNA-binding NarL/FixJ family response regulator
MKAKRRPRVLLADDHTLLLDAFEKLLEPECDVVGTVGDGRALLAAAEQLRPDVIVLDIAMPLLNGLDAGRQLKKALPDVKLIFLTMNQDPALATEAFRVGATGYLLKTSAASELLKAIEEAINGRSYVTPMMTQDLLEALTSGLQEKKSARQPTLRQREVLQLLAEGCSMKEAARILGVTPRTIAFHKYRIMEQFRLKSNAELIQFAIRQGVVQIQPDP